MATNPSLTAYAAFTHGLTNKVIIKLFFLHQLNCLCTKPFVRLAVVADLYSKWGICRADGNGTVGTAMYRFFEEEKWRRLDSNLTCVIECPLRALRRSLGRLRGL